MDEDTNYHWARRYAMEQHDLDELLAYARQAGQILKTIFKDLTDEELELESAVRNYPILALAVAAGAGAAAGWWAANRRRGALPPPAVSPDEPSSPMSLLEQRFPSVERIRKSIPESMTDDAAALAKNWMDNVLEPRLKQGVDSLSANMAESKWGSLFRQAMQRMDSGEDIQLDDPEEPES
jgi:hypothetical protein